MLYRIYDVEEITKPIPKHDLYFFGRDNLLFCFHVYRKKICWFIELAETVGIWSKMHVLINPQGEFWVTFVPSSLYRQAYLYKPYLSFRDLTWCQWDNDPMTTFKCLQLGLNIWDRRSYYSQHFRARSIINGTLMPIFPSLFATRCRSWGCKEGQNDWVSVVFRHNWSASRNEYDATRHAYAMVQSSRFYTPIAYFGEKY